MYKQMALTLANFGPIKNLVLKNAEKEGGFVRKFIAGETLEDVVKTAKRLNDAGFSVTINHLGEDVSDWKEVEKSRYDYLDILAAIKENNLDADIAVKLSRLGLFHLENLGHLNQITGENSAYQNLRKISSEARQKGIFVWTDMESYPFSDATIDIVSAIGKESGNDGVAIQSYLRRSRKQVDLLYERESKIPVRLVKGAYKESSEVVFQKRSETDDNFSHLMRLLIGRGHRTAIATHDEKLVEEAKAFLKGKNIGRKENVEFQFLYGIREDLQRQTLIEGYNVRIYVPFGSDWYGYFSRRIAERPANALFVAKSLAR